ncbi:hypothetical protein BUE76_01050 [Cnuella takakiae]|nr:hypothetical protein BUE76_01050 [Cnuella takakiae]
MPVQILLLTITGTCQRAAAATAGGRRNLAIVAVSKTDFMEAMVLKPLAGAVTAKKTAGQWVRQSVKRKLFSLLKVAFHSDEIAYKQLVRLKPFNAPVAWSH